MPPTDTKNFEIRKSHGKGWNVYAIFPGGQTMFAGNFKTEEEANSFCMGRFGG